MPAPLLVSVLVLMIAVLMVSVSACKSVRITRSGELPTCKAEPKPPLMVADPPLSRMPFRVSVWPAFNVRLLLLRLRVLMDTVVWPVIAPCSRTLLPASGVLPLIAAPPVELKPVRMRPSLINPAHEPSRGIVGIATAVKKYSGINESRSLA